jgi:hypothetical protein
MPRGTRPKITWGTAFANTLTFGVQIDDALNYSLPRDGSDWVQAPSGVEDAWIAGNDQVLEARVRWVPIADTVTPVAATGFDGAAGWRAFLEWARDKNVFRFYPDAAQTAFLPCYLVEPITDHGQALEKGYKHRSIALKMRTSDGSAFTGY